MVERIRQSMYDVLIHPFAVVLYPAFSNIKDDHQEQKKILGQIIVVTGTLVFPAIAGAAITASMYVPLFFGEAWKPAIPVLQLLLITGGTTPFIIIMRDILRAHNQTGTYLRVQTILVAGNVMLMFFLAPHGLVPLSWDWSACRPWPCRFTYI